MEIFNDYAVEVNYLGPVKKCLWPERLGNVAAYSVFDISDMEEAKMHASFSYNVMSSSDIHHEFAITNEHLQGTEYTKVEYMEFHKFCNEVFYCKILIYFAGYVGRGSCAYGTRTASGVVRIMHAEFEVESKSQMEG